MSERTKTRAPRALRRQVARALAKALRVIAIQKPDGTLVAVPNCLYMWGGILPDGEPFMFTTTTSALEYAGLVDEVATRSLDGRRGSFAISHTAECRKLGVGCTCSPTIRADADGGET